MTALAIEQGHFELGLAPVADAFNGTVYSDIVSLKNHGKVRFLVVSGVGTTGTVTFTVEASDDTSGSNVSAVPFHYRTTVAGGTPGAITAATTAGFTSAAGSNQMHEIEINAEALCASGYTYARLKCVEVVNDPILAGILIQMLHPRHAGKTAATATV